MESQTMDTGSVSLMLQKVTDYADELQSTNPLWSRSKILATVRLSIEQGHFGELSTLLQPPPPSPQRRSTIIVEQPPEYRPYPTQYARQATPPPQPSEGTVNPATLQLTVEPEPQFSYTDALNKEEYVHAHFDPETSHEMEYETGAPVHYVSRPSLTSIDNQDMHEPYASFHHTTMRYPVDHREFIYPVFR